MQIGDTLDTRLLPSHTLGERIPCCMQRKRGKRILRQDPGANKRKQRRERRERNEKKANEREKKREEREKKETYQNKLWPHGMRAALISPSKQTMQSRLEREVLLGLVAPLRLPKDPRDSVGELEVDPPETPVEKVAKMVPLVEEENPES